MSLPPPIPNQLTSIRPECDISKTQIMVDLFAIPLEHRDPQWKQFFLDNVSTASFACDDPQVMTGPDGFPYFILRTPEPMKSFTSYCIQNMKDDFLLHNGWGIVLNPVGEKADWVFTYGDILNYHINNVFYTTIENSDLKGSAEVQINEEIFIAQPSEHYLPTGTRNLIRGFMKKNGIRKPKVMMITRSKDGHVIQELAFNIFKEDYPTAEKLNTILGPISWLLPIHYIIVVMSEKAELKKGLVEL